MATLDGVYYIRSALNENKPSLVPGPDPGYLPPRPVPMLGADVGGPGFTKYRVNPAGPPGSNLYTIALANPPATQLIVQNDLLWIFAGEASTVFRADPAEGNRRIVGIPFENKVWTLEKVRDQVKLKGQNGSTGQRWIFEKVQ